MPIFIFLHCKSMATISCHSNQSSYPIGTKNNIIRSPMPVKYGKHRLHGFRRDVVWKCWRRRWQRRTDDDGRPRTDGRRRTTADGRTTVYTISSPMSLWLRWAKIWVNQFVISRSVYFKMTLAGFISISLWIDCLFEICKIAVCFLWLSLPGDCRVTDEALLAETT